MHEHQKQLVRQATLLRAQYHCQRRAQRAHTLSHLRNAVGPCLERLARDGRLLRRAISCGWELAASRLERRFRRDLQELQRGIEAHGQQFCEPASIPSLGELFQELTTAGEEFGGIEIDDDEQRISVITEPVRLEGVYLGPFRIDLLPADVSQQGPLTRVCVEAMDPHPASSNEDVTHPHVDSGYLCSGDGWTAIQNALLQGRLSEYFLLVRSVLYTYNDASPYVRLGEWHGTECTDCGAVISHDEAIYCHRCDSIYCDECSQCCDVCSVAGCYTCLQESELSDRRVCERCTATCKCCGMHCACDEVEAQRCQDCRENDDDASTSNMETTNGQETQEATQES